MSSTQRVLRWLTVVFIAGQMVLYAGCRSDEITSSINFVHRTGEDSLAGPLGQLLAAKSGLFAHKKYLDVCVQRGDSPKLSADQTLLEVQMAYASWLSATGVHAESDWQRFRFELRESCELADPTFESLVFFVRKSQTRETGVIGSRFKPNYLNCKRWDSNSISCNKSSLTRGWAQPGTANLNRSRTESSYVQASKSRAFMSPYLSWHSLSEELRRQGHDRLGSATQKILLKNYDALLATPAAERLMIDLTELVNTFALHKVIGSDDPIEKEIMDDFTNGSQPEIDIIFAPEKVAFSTLLHEVGHQFGMMHAHAPAEDAISGSSPDATKNPNGFWETSAACMAYGPDYLYLTEDDMAGQRSNFKHVRLVFEAVVGKLRK